MVKRADGAEALKKPSVEEGVLGDGNRTKKIQASRDFVFRPPFRPLGATSAAPAGEKNAVEVASGRWSVDSFPHRIPFSRGHS